MIIVNTLKTVVASYWDRYFPLDLRGYLIEINPPLAHVSANGLVVKYSFAMYMEVSCAGGSIPPWRNRFVVMK